jgi:hypothetical protein
MFETIGYQTIENRDNTTEVLDKAPFICYRKDAWLGYGYYFWDNSLYYAKKWGEDGYKIKGYIICKTELKIDNLFDLVGNVEHQQIFKTGVNKFQSKAQKKLRFSEVLDLLKKHPLKFDYQAIRAADENPNTEAIPFTERGYNGPLYVINPRIQICVFEKYENVFFRPVEIIEPSLK